jgi:phosphoenolpyruvate-protein kinase (PTS system EI component)
MTFRLQGTPYVPGCVGGPVQRGLGPGAETSIVVLTQNELPLRGPTPLGLIIAGAAPLSHPMARLRTLGVPVVMIDAAAAALLPWGHTIALDGSSGLIASEILQPLSEPHPSPGVALTTADGTRVALRTSVGSAAGAASAVAKGASAIGLVRSEYLFPASGARPDAAFLQSALATVCAAAHPLPVTVRLVDIATDKRPPWLGEVPGLAGILGLQGARLYDIEPVRSVLYAELEALAALTDQFELRVLIPYLTQLEELERWRAEIRARLAVPVGAMLETPAAALAVSSWMQEADFVALGCNDLMQCLFAADRDQPQLAHLLDPYAPTLYRFLRQVADEAGNACGSIQVCGLLSQLPGVLPLLLGLGYRCFSVDPVMVPWLAQTARTTSLSEAEAQAEAACRARHSAELRALLGQ